MQGTSTLARKHKCVRIFFKTHTSLPWEIAQGNVMINEFVDGRNNSKLHYTEDTQWIGVPLS